MKLTEQIDSSESVLWYGKKERDVSVLKSVFSSILPFVLIRVLVDGGLIRLIWEDTMQDKGSPGILAAGFFLLHLMPVRLYIGGALTSGLRTEIVMRPYSRIFAVTLGQQESGSGL